jgi:5-methylcytosine-specific restriction endonuclease McrA
MSSSAEGFRFTCEIGACGEPVFKRGCCLKHYKEKNHEHNSGKPAWRKNKTYKKLRLQVLIEADYLCELKLPGCEVQAFTVDHVIAIEDGGAPLDRVNLQATCQKCNSQKELRARKSRDYDQIGRRRYGSVSRG